MKGALAEAGLTPEEAYLWRCAAGWLGAGELPDPSGLDWDRVIAICRPNSMQMLLYGLLDSTGQLARVPEGAAKALGRDAARLTAQADRMGEALRRYLQLAAASGLETVVLKGLWLSLKVYEHAAARPGVDIDLLVRRAQVEECLTVLSEMGVGAFWANLLDDDYYARHHLHYQRSTEDLRIWFEIHWALDHPYTLLTIDYDALMDRTTPGELLGQPVRELSPPDLLLSLAIHLVKHAVYLPNALDRPDLARLILADGMLVSYLDVAEILRIYSDEIDWEATLELAGQWGAAEILGSVLQVCRRNLEAPVPERVLASLPVRGSGRAVRRFLGRMADYKIAAYRGEQRSSLWQHLLVANAAFVLRPIRLVDTAAYLLPAAEYLRRRYGKAGTATRLRHFLLALTRFMRFGFDSLYFGWLRYRRLKALGQSASLPHRLDVGA